MFANYHTHTSRCQHATGEDREYVEAAIQTGIKILGFSDHCPWPFPDDYVSHIRMLPSEVDDYFDSLTALKKEYASDITLYIGFEAEYDPSLNHAQELLLADYPVDYMILGQHFLGTESESFYAGSPSADEAVLKQYVDLAIDGINTGKYLYLAHPDLIHYTGPDAVYEKHMLRLCNMLKEKDIPVELNILGLWDGRQYPSRRFLSIAQRVGNSAIIGMDAHAPQQLRNTQTVEQAEALCRQYGLKLIEQLPLH